MKNNDFEPSNGCDTTDWTVTVMKDSFVFFFSMPRSHNIVDVTPQSIVNFNDAGFDLHILISDCLPFYCYEFGRYMFLFVDSSLSFIIAARDLCIWRRGVYLQWHKEAPLNCFLLSVLLFLFSSRIFSLSLSLYILVAQRRIESLKILADWIMTRVFPSNCKFIKFHYCSNAAGIAHSVNLKFEN